MDGIHDLGGMHGFGAIGVEPAEPPFHEPWEGRVHGVMLALAASGKLRGVFRHAIERMDPVEYLDSTYYEHWLAAVETLLCEAGATTPRELGDALDRIRDGQPVAQRRDPEAAARIRVLLRPFGARERHGPAARFRAGDRVVVSRRSSSGHTRCPRYVRGVAGVVDRVHAPTPLPDLLDSGEIRPEPQYTVVFESSAVWGSEAERFRVSVDLWESYLEAVR